MLEDNDGLCPKIINLQMETSIHVYCLYPFILFIKPLRVNKEILLLSRHKVLCATPLVSGKFSLHRGTELDTDGANKEQ